MKVKLLVSRSGVAGSENRGDEIEVSNAEAKRMIEAAQAVPVRDDPSVETTAKGKRKAKDKPEAAAEGGDAG